MVCRSIKLQHDASREPCCDRVGVSDGAWVKHGACDVHRQGTAGPDGLRGHRLGVGDIGQVSGWTWISGHSPRGDDSWGARWQRQPRMVGGRGWSELDTPGESSRHGISVGDGAWVEHGARDVHGSCTHRTDGLRGDRLGVGDVLDMHDGPWIKGISTSYNFGWLSVRKFITCTFV